MTVDPNYKIKANELSNKVIIVTGTSQGFGKATSLNLASAGATVILLGRDLSALEATYDEIVAKKYPQPVLYGLDLLGATPQDYAVMAEAIEEKFGKLDGIVHNAATLGTMMTLEQYDVKTWYEVMQVNLHAPFLLTQACLPLLLKSYDARLVFVSDKAGRKPKAYWGAYGVSKAGLENYAMTLADELESTNIRINTLDVGAMKTSIRSRSHPAQNLDLLPLPEHISPSIVYLFSQKSINLHKQALTIIETHEAIVKS